MVTISKNVTTVSDGSVGKESTCDAGDVGSIPGNLQEGNPGVPRLVQVTSGGFSWWL